MLYQPLHFARFVTQTRSLSFKVLKYSEVWGLITLEVLTVTSAMKNLSAKVGYLAILQNTLSLADDPESRADMMRLLYYCFKRQSAKY